MSESILLNNRYELTERLGSGGMAVVYRAHDITLERDVAIKILRENFTADPAFRERFRQEAKAAANLSHPNIVTVHDFGFDAGRVFIVMEYVPGDHLKNMLQKRGRFTVEEALDLMIQACAGVGYAHRAGLVHCDIKPHNILITPDKRVKVTDFGIARALASIQPEEKSEVVWGSPQYFSPEQAAGLAPSPASDVYSLGVVLYEMLTMHLPFTGSTANELARKHREELPASPSTYNPAIPLALEQVMIKVLSKESAARYRTADQMGRILMTIKQPQGVAPPLNGAQPLDFPPDESPQVLQPHPDVPVTTHAAGSRPIAGPTPVVFSPPPAKERDPYDIDWLTVILGLIALIAVGGLFPFYLWISYLYR